MAGFPDLRTLQQLFWRLIRAPEGVAKEASELVRSQLLEAEDLSFLVRVDARLGPVERLDIYADMYFYRLRDCLAEDFPKLAALIGKKRFHNLVTDYLLAHPPTHPSLRELGRALPGYLRSQRVGIEFPAAADLAELEWAHLDVFDESDAEPLKRDDLLARANPEFALALIPACRRLRLEASTLALWNRLNGDESAAPNNGQAPSPETVAVRVWRKGFETFHRAISADEEAALRAMSAGGATLAELGEILLADQPGEAPPERSAQRLAELLDLWAQAELLSAEPSTGWTIR